MTFSLIQSSIWRLFRMSVRFDDFTVVCAVKVFLFKYTFVRITRSGKCCWTRHMTWKPLKPTTLESFNIFKAEPCRSVKHFFTETELNTNLNFLWLCLARVTLTRAKEWFSNLFHARAFRACVRIQKHLQAKPETFRLFDQIWHFLKHFNVIYDYITVSRIAWAFC